MQTLPLFFKLQQKSVLIIGGGEVAYRKADLLAQSGAYVHVVAKHIKADLYRLLDNPCHQLQQKVYEIGDLQNKVLVIVATDDQSLKAQVYHDAQQMGVLVNVVDTPKLCDFIFPAIVDRSPVVVAVSSDGTAPVLARLLRAKIETLLPSDMGRLAQAAGEFRKTVKQTLSSLYKRRRFWEGVFADVLADKMPQACICPKSDHKDTTGDRSDAKNSTCDLTIGTNYQSILWDKLQAFVANDKPTGEVYIVGSGAGDPDLLTFKALRLMQQAEVVLYDALVPKAILDLCRRDSHKIFVGKKRSCHSKTQEEIGQLLVSFAKKGQRVLRLKGGDPFIFGRGGEELLACQEANVPCQVVSGITAGLAAASGTGIPLTHRGVATSVRFLTGCYKTGEQFTGLKSTYHADETLVFYMGLHALSAIIEGLSELPNDTPVAIIANASLPDQQVLTGTLDNIISRQDQAKLQAPAVIIVGRVVGLYVKA